MAIIADAWNMHGDVGTGGWIVMVFAMLLFWGALVALVVCGHLEAALQHLPPVGPRHGAHPASPLPRPTTG